MPEFQGRAHGKTILIGEHSVVHGTPALAMPVGLYTQVALGDTPAAGLNAAFVTWFRELASSHAGRELVPARIGGNLPQGVGLGSSAALAVACLRALAQVKAIRDHEMREFADAAERIFHGEPSGLDVRTVLAEQPLKFQRAHDGQPGTVQPLEVTERFDFDLWVSAPGLSTADMVKVVTAALQASQHRRALAEARALVEVAESALGSGDRRALGRAMTEFHAWLSFYGASTAVLDDLVRRALHAGAAGAKLTGAGGGGAVLVLWPTADVPAVPLPTGVRRFSFTLPV